MTPSLIAKAIDMASLGEPHSSVGEHDGTIRVVEDYRRSPRRRPRSTSTSRNRWVARSPSP